MRLTVIEGKTERASFQRGLEAQVKSALQSQGQRNIGYPGGNQNAELFSNGAGQLWAAFANLPDASIPRCWNAFGVYNTESRSQQIAVEINIPIQEASGQIAGFFARDPETEHVYLMHDGGIGGGKAGVGKEAFLTWSKITLEEALRSDGRVREGIIIGRVDTPDLPSRIWSFVQQVSDFKTAVRSGEFDTAAALADVDGWNDFKDEPTGRRRGTRSSKIDYVTYHGDVVRALRDKRQATCADDERVLNSRLIDLYVRCGAALTEVYEVKTSVDRQSIYTAIGQLMTHGPADGGSIKRVLALPPGQLAADLEHGLDALGITVQRFDVSGEKSPRVTLL